jgi:hypothetical protein
LTTGGTQTKASHRDRHNGGTRSSIHILLGAFPLSRCSFDRSYVDPAQDIRFRGRIPRVWDSKPCGAQHPLGRIVFSFLSCTPFSLEIPELDAQRFEKNQGCLLDISYYQYLIGVESLLAGEGGASHLLLYDTESHRRRQSRMSTIFG